MAEISKINLVSLNAGQEESSRHLDSAAYALGLLFTTTILIAFGVTMLYSASYTLKGAKFFNNQLLSIMIGATGALTAVLFGFRRISRWRMPILFGCWGMLLIAALLGKKINGACRWIQIPLPGIGNFTIQPSEFTKIALCICVAAYCAEFSRSFTYFKQRNGLLPILILIGITCCLVLCGHDLGTTILIVICVSGILYAAGLLWRYILAGLFLGCTGLGCYLVLFDPMRLGRILSAGDPVKMAQGKGYQLYNSLMALGSGGWFGLGFGESRLKNTYLPEQHTDFILAVVGEELGLTALLLVLLFYFLWGFFALRISLRCQSRLGMLLGFGLTIAVEVQALINLAVISGSAPTKGMPAPFISYGGSNLISSMLAVGLLLSIALENCFPGYNDQLLNSIKEKFRRK